MITIKLKNGQEREVRVSKVEKETSKGRLWRVVEVRDLRKVHLVYELELRVHDDKDWGLFGAIWG